MNAHSANNGCDHRGAGPAATRRRAFTLVEMLVVIVIILMLAGIVLVAVRGAEESARETRSQATIAKLDNIIRTIYESYHTRRVPIDTSGMHPLAAAQTRLAVIRDLMRMEMPERRTDITTDPLFGEPEPSLHRAYRARLIAANGPMANNGPAECLYMIVCLAGEEDARSQFSSDEVGDTDGNGLPEFLDGWGRPIFFLRWAPGFNDSNRQWNVFAAADRTAADQQDHDPFDTRRVESATAAPPRPAWRLEPLIYSAGRDGQYGVGVDDVSGVYVWGNDTYTRAYLMGTPTGDTLFDNIHNHANPTP